jgi:hypothetical protein
MVEMRRSHKSDKNAYDGGDSLGGNQNYGSGGDQNYGSGGYQNYGDSGNS